MLALFAQDATQEEELFCNIFRTPRPAWQRCRLSIAVRSGRARSVSVSVSAVPADGGARPPASRGSRGSVAPRPSPGSRWGGLAGRIRFALSEMAALQ